MEDLLQFTSFGSLFLILVIFFVFFIIKSVYLVKQAEAIIIERFGKFEKILTPGIHLIIPFIERPREVVWTYIEQIDPRYYSRYKNRSYRIDLRESVYDFPKQNVITRDNVTMEINALLYYQITDPKAAVYEVLNLPEAIEKLTQTTLRNVIGSLDLDESLVSRDKINEKLRIILDEATDKWGVKVNRVELQEVNPPKDIRQAMEKQMRAERDKRANILEAEGLKRSAILKAEGEKDSKILKAEGEAEARLKVAEAESKAIKKIQESMSGKDAAPYLIAMQYIKTLPEMTKDKTDKMILMPYESSSLISSLTSLTKIFKNIDK